MPTYVVTDPNTGQKVRLTGDSPPSEAELEEIFSSLTSGPSRAEREARIAALDEELAQTRTQPISPQNDPRMAALTVGSSVVAEPASGIAGIGGGLSGIVQRDIENKMNRLGLRGPSTVDPIARAASAVETTRDALTIAPQNQASERVLDLVGAGGESVMDAVRLPVSGLSGLANLPFRGIEGASETIENIQEEGIGPTLGRSAQDLGAPPSVSAALETIPTGIGTVAGARSPIARRTPEAPQSQVSVGRPSLDEAVDVTPNTDQILRDIRRTRPESVADEVLPDRQVIEAAQRLGVDLNVEHYSTNAAFQSVARALKSQPSSSLAAAEVNAIRDLSQRADDLVTEIGGAIYRGAVSDEILISMRGQVNQMRQEASRLYDQVDVPAVTQVDTQGLRTFIDRRLAELGGDESLLAGPERAILGLLERNEGRITYGALDRVRKDVGEGFNNRGPFTDSSDFVLREVYDELSQAQNGVAEAMGFGEIYANARSLVARRKSLEDDIVTLFGRDIGGSLVPRIRQAALNIPKGDVASFRRMMNALPESRRGEVAATVLSEMFAGGSRQGGAMGTGFATTWRNLSRNETARDLLYTHLPEGTAQTVDDIGRTIDAIVRSNARPLGNPSGTAGPIIRALEDGSIANRLYDHAQRQALARVTGIGPILNKVVDQPADRVAAADRFLTSQTFKDAVGVALDGDIERANRIATASPQYRQWVTTMPEGTVQEIAQVGFIGWLLAQEE